MRVFVIGTAALGVAVVLGGRAFDGLSSRDADGAIPVAAAFPTALPSGTGRVADPVDDALTAMIQRNCTVCHNDQMLTGQLSLQRFDVAKADEQAQTAE